MTKKEFKKAVLKYLRNLWKELKIAIPNLFESVLQVIHAFLPFEIFTINFWLE